MRRNFGRITLATALVAGTVVTSSAPSSAATPRWSIKPSPSPPGPPSGSLAGVSCSSPTSCFAVGASGAFGEDAGILIERWNGTRWTVVAGSKIAGANQIELNAVACSSPTSCVAVGVAETVTTTDFSLNTLALRWNGINWARVASPNPKNAEIAVLNAVSCSSSTDCFAVGSSSSSSIFEEEFDSDTLVEHWNGSKWTIVASPNPSGAPAELAGVSCTSATSCFAVGSASNQFGTGTLVERWNGASWSIVSSPDPAPAAASVNPHDLPTPQPIAELNAVSCTSATSCFAVGDSTAGTLTERWDGATWSIVASPNPAGVDDAELTSVSCSNAGDCFAVGNGFNQSTGPSQEEDLSSLIEHWDGVAWSIIAAADDARRIPLSGVSCPSSTSCFAVGESASPLLWDGKNWSIAPFGAKSSQSSLLHVACSSPNNCFAVGFYSTTSDDRTLIERWNGTRWSIVPSPNPTGAFVARLSDVSCASATNCTAVGASETFSGEKTLIEHWNGTKWSIVTSPNPSGSVFAALVGVSCPTAKSCNAVGVSGADITTRAFGVHWNGAKWSIVAGTNPPGARSSQLVGVSCASATNCTAVGAYVTGGTPIGIKALIERWNGTRWSVVASPTTPNALEVLVGVSCPNATSCVAVGLGASITNPTGGAVAKHWNGTKWTIVPTPKAGGGQLRDLSAVSCRSAVSCYAVGSTGSPSSTKTLVEHWNGAGWTVVATPNPANSSNASFSGVACPSAICMAVGSYAADGGSFTLTERGS